MANLNTYQPITSNDDYDFKVEDGKRFVFSASGNFGGGTLTLKYLVKGNEVLFVEGELTEPGGFEVMPPVETMRVSLVGATSPNIDVVVLEVHDGKR